MLIKRRLVGLALVTAAGCSPFEPRAGFDQVSQLVADRVGTEAVWLTGGEEDKRVRDRVAALLAEPLSVDDVARVVLLNNLELQATYQELGVAQADVVQAGLLTNPTLGLERRFPGRTLEADVTLGFLDVFLIPLRKRVAGAAFEAAKFRVTSEAVKHAFEARTSYFELQEKMQIQELRERVVLAQDASVESVRRLREAGNVPLLDVRREELLAAEARLELTATEGEVVEARERLNRLMGLWGQQTRWSVPGRLPELPAVDAVPEELEAIAVESRLDLASARRELEAAAEGVGIAQISAILPDLSLTGHFEREPDGAETTGPSIDVPLPFFNWGIAASGRAKAEFAQRQRRYAALAIEIRSHVRQAYARMGIARARANFYRREVLPLQAEALEQTQLQFNGMQVGVFQLLDAKREQIEAAEKYIESLHDYWAARTALEVALGRTLPLSAAPPPSADPSAPPQAAHATHNHH